MKICWDNIEGLYLTKSGNLRDDNKRFFYFSICEYCGEDCLNYKKETRFCCNSCSSMGENNSMYGKVSKGFLGGKHSLETRHKMSLKQCGNKNHFCGMSHTSESIEKMSGENHHGWKGGISCEPYCSEWTKDYKDYIKWRDDYKCLNYECSGISNKLCVHHIDYNKKNCVSENLITICNSCNSRSNFNREAYILRYRKIMLDRYGYEYSDC